MLEGRFMDSRGLSWDLMAWGFTTAEPEMGGWTFKPAAHLCQEAACVISLGGAFQIYNNPQRNGHLTGWHQDIMAEVARFVRARQPWCQDTETVPQVAVLHAASHFYAAQRRVADGRVGQTRRRRWWGRCTRCWRTTARWISSASRRCIERMGDYKLVVIPEQTHLPEAMKTALAAYVRAGGTRAALRRQCCRRFRRTGRRAAGRRGAGRVFLPAGGPRSDHRERPVAAGGAARRADAAAGDDAAGARR